MWNEKFKGKPGDGISLLVSKRTKNLARFNVTDEWTNHY